MHVLVTGGAGFIGSHIAEYHLDMGDHVHVVDNLSTGSRTNIAGYETAGSFRFDQQDLLEWDDLHTAVAWADRIYHMAAVVGVKRVLDNPVKVMSTNIAGTERILRSVHQGGWNPQMLIASSSEVYGFNGQPALEETHDLVFRSAGRLRWSYATAKLADEFLAFSYVRHYDMNITIARLFNTIGPRQTGRHGMVVPRFIDQAVKNEPITVYGDGSQTRSFCDVKDTVRALDLLASCQQAKGEVVNVGSAQEVSIGKLATLIRKRAGSRSEIEYSSYREAYGAEFEDIQQRRPILTKLHNLTGFVPHRKLAQTIDELIAIARGRL